MAFTAQSVSILNGQDVVDVNSAESIENIKAGDFLQIGSFPLVEIKQAYKNGQGQKFIQLTKAWELTTQSNQPAIVIPTSGEFRAAVKALQDANILVNDNQQALQDYQNNLGTVTFKKSDGTTTTVKTLKQIEADNQAQMNAYHPNPWAMRKVEFEAMRAANREKYGASGFVHFGKHRDTGGLYNAVNEGLYTSSDIPNVLNLGRAISEPNASGASKEGYPVIHIAGVLTDFSGFLNTPYGVQLKLPPAEDGRRTWDSSTGVSLVHAASELAFASESSNIKVVTDRSDLACAEAYLREINDTDPFVYKHGIIQSTATSIDGIPTTIDNVRVTTYFATYIGESANKGRGINWQTATEQQRATIASNPKNNIYFDDETGKFYQWCLRLRSVEGFGNGDWAIFDSAINSAGGSLRFDSNNDSCISPQGIRDTVVNSRINHRYHDHYFIQDQGNPAKSDLGIFTATKGNGPYSDPVTDVAVDGECYLYVFDSITRLNKGAHHPFNELGTAKLRLNTGVGGAKMWHENEAKSPRNRADCFSFGDDLTVGDVAPFVGNNWGAIIAGSTLTGRSDGRYYDGIGASGQGGVCRDMRYSAHKLTVDDFAQEDLKIKSGKYRGREILLKTSIIQGQLTATGSSRNIYITDSNLGSLVTTGTKFYVVSSDGTVQSSIVGTIGVTGFISNDTLNNLETVTHVIVSMHEKLSISGEFTHKEVFGHPVNILLCEDLKDGFIGNWNPNLPDGQVDTFELSRPYSGTGSDIKRTYTVDGGTTWTSGTVFLSNTTKNETEFSNMPANQVTIYEYKTKAKMTQPAPIAEIHGSISDINYLFTSMDSGDKKGRLLNFSLTGLIQTHAAAATKIGLEHIRLESLPILPDLGKFWGLNVSAGELRHAPLSLDAPSNNGPAFKALNYNVAKNQQGFINYAYAQLTYDATAGDWGDDGKIHIADNQTTMLDENGHTNLVGMACCVEPIGWV